MSHHTKRIVAFVAALMCAVGLACSSSPAKTATGPSTGGTPANIVKVSGDSQTGPYLSPLPKPLVVKVTDSAGNAVTNTPVAWATLLDGASLIQNITVTDATGQTRLTPVMNGLPGAFSVDAAVNGHGVTFAGSSDITFANGFTNIVSGLFASCGLTKQGVAFCWGNGSGAQLGNPTAQGPHTGPVPVAGGQTFVQISMYDFDACGLTSGGSVFCWGDQTNGVFGNGVAPGGPLVWTPTAAASGRSFSLIAVGDGASCGLSSGVAYCWGENNEGQLGTGDTVHHWSPTPVKTPTGVSFAWLGSVGTYSCGLTSAGAAYCWGSNYSGQLGIGSSSTIYSTVPVPVTGGHVFTALTLGSVGMCGLTTGGTVYCWGTALNGNGTSAEETSPAAIQQSGLTFAAISAGGIHACGVTTSGAGYCWGQNYEGELGSGSFSASIGATPLPVTGGLTFSTLVAGGSLTCGYTTNNVMYCWGSNSIQQLGLPAAMDSIAADTMFDAPIGIPGMIGQP